MAYFVSFGNFENANFPKGSRTQIDNAIKLIAKQNNLITKADKSGFVDYGIIDTQSEDEVACTLELPQNNVYQAILNALKAETDNSKMTKDISASLSKIQENDTNKRVAISKKQSEVAPSESIDQKDTASDDIVEEEQTFQEEEPIKKVEKPLKSQPQHQKVAKIMKKPKVKKDFMFELDQSLIKLGGLILGGLIILFLIFSFVGQKQKNAEVTAQLNNKIEKLELLQKEQGKIDTFSRFFIPVYFKGETKSINPFVTESLKDLVKTDGNQSTKSMLFNGLSKDGKTYKTTYVVYLTDGDQGTYKKVTLYMKPSKNIYEFELVKQPVIKEY